MTTRSGRGLKRDAPLTTLTAIDDDSNTTSVDHATTVIRNAIILGEYEPGARIKVSDVTQKFGLGNMPVREALRKLEGEGIVTIAPNRGATVRSVDRKFIADMFEVRTTLESMVLRRCVANMTLDKLEHLEELRENHARAVAGGDTAAILDATGRFHIALFEIADNEEATRLFTGTWYVVNALRMRYRYSANRLQTMQREFRELLQALRQGNAEQAVSIIQMHNRAGMEELLERLNV